jgi:pimeloyl-ACP methyl ester carboxylesterase
MSGETSGSAQANICLRSGKSAEKWGRGMFEVLDHGVRLAFIDERPAPGDRGEPILLIHGFASTHAVNWVFPQWVKTLTEAGRRVVAFDNRGHGRSEKFHDPAAYAMQKMAEDARALLDHLHIETADVMGYSMGARIAAFFAKAHASRVRSMILGGLGHHLVDRAGLPLAIAEAMEAPSLAGLVDPTQRMFRAFAEATKSDLKALRLCAGCPPSYERDRSRRNRCPRADRGRNQGRCRRRPA